MKTDNSKFIAVQTGIKSTIDKVWECWTQPEHIINWNFANEDWCCPIAENDVKPNGKFSWRMEAKDGTIGFNFEGTYDEVIEKELLTYKIEDGRLVTIEFMPKDNEIVLKESFEAEGTNSDDQQRAGWQAILENFKHYVESQD